MNKPFLALIFGAGLILGANLSSYFTDQEMKHQEELFIKRKALYRMIVLQEAANQANALNKNRAPYERVKFRATHLGIALDM